MYWTRRSIQRRKTTLNWYRQSFRCCCLWSRSPRRNFDVLGFLLNHFQVLVEYLYFSTEYVKHREPRRSDATGRQPKNREPWKKVSGAQTTLQHAMTRTNSAPSELCRVFFVFLRSPSRCRDRQFSIILVYQSVTDLPSNHRWPIKQADLSDLQDLGDCPIVCSLRSNVKTCKCQHNRGDMLQPSRE